jgi:Ran-binding protein 3
MNDATNGTDATTAGDQSTSGSESGRGRLRRKRSHEDFEDGEEQVKKRPEHHVRKKSRDITSPKDINFEAGEKPSKSSVSRIDEHGDEVMDPNNRPSTPEAGVSDKGEAMVTSPKNKRSRDQASSGEGASIVQTVETVSKASQSNDKTEEERNPKRQRDKSEPLAATTTKDTQSKVCNISLSIHRSFLIETTDSS